MMNRSSKAVSTFRGTSTNMQSAAIGRKRRGRARVHGMAWLRYISTVTAKAYITYIRPSPLLVPT